MCGHFAERGLGTGNLLPPDLRIEILGVAAAEYLKRRSRVSLEIDLGLRVLMPEPVRRDKIGYQYPADFIALRVRFDWIADLAGPEHAVQVLVGAVEPWIDGHFAHLVCRADAHAGVVIQDSFHENL